MGKIKDEAIRKREEKENIGNVSEVPTGWRAGQTVFNFLEWLSKNKNVSTNQNARMADPFHLSDEEWYAYYKEFLKQHEPRTKR